MSSLLNNGILNSRMIPCSLAISRGHKNAAHTAPSGVRSAISEMKNNDDNDNEQNQDEEFEEKTETQENVKFHFQAPPMLVQKIPRQLSSLLQSTCFPNHKLHFQNFCSTAVGLLSSRSNFVSKCKRNQKLTANNFEVRLTSPREEIP